MAKVKRQKSKWVVGSIKRVLLPFCHLPFAFFLLIFCLSSCNWKVKPTFPASRVVSDFKAMCLKDYHLKVEARRQGDNLQAFFWRLGLLKPGELEMRPEAADALEKVLEAAARVSLSTDAPLKFLEVKMADVLTGATVTLWRYVPDIRDSMYTRIAMEEYLNRLVLEMNAEAPAKGNEWKEIEWDAPITMKEFLAKQVVLRAKRESPVGLQAHEDLSKPATLVVVIENWPTIAQKGADQKEKVARLVEKTARIVMHGYNFAGFRDVVLQDSRGAPLQRWRL
jgi:hypothetical protein